VDEDSVSARLVRQARVCNADAGSLVNWELGAEGTLTRESAEATRIRLEYKRLILLGKVRLPLAAAQAFVGPDCAYHLYSAHQPPASRTAGKASRRRVSSRRRRGGS
jgi:hypothetical protein